MIQTKEELEFYLEADKYALQRKGKPNFFGDEIWVFQITLRKCEYYKNKGGINKLFFLYYKIKFKRLSIKLGFDIPEGVFGAGLRINHYGNIIVNVNSKIGQWCDIHQGVNIGASNPLFGSHNQNVTPIIGNNVWIGPGAKIYGGITIGNEVQVGVNAVVNKSFESDITIAGVPAKKISDAGTSLVNISANKNVAKSFFSLYPEFKKFSASEL